MAHTKNSTMVTWAWILGVVALAILLFVVALPFLNRSAQPLAERGISTSTMETPFGIGGAEEDVITDPAMLVTVMDPAAYEDRDVQLASARVQSVLSDRVFLVGETRERSFVVVRQDQLGVDDPQPSAGARINVEGQVKELNMDGDPFDQIGTTSTQQLENKRIYVEAESIEIVQ